MPLKGGRLGPGAVAGKREDQREHLQRQDVRKVINISGCKGSSLETIAACVKTRPSWKLSDKAKALSDDIYVVIQRESLHVRIGQISDVSMVSKFPGMYSLCEKVHFTRAMNFAISMLPGGFNDVTFWPRTWIIPEEMDEAARAMEKTLMKWSRNPHKNDKQPPVWIVKPEAGSQGDGIFFVENGSKLEEKMSTRLGKGNWVCQDYVHDPLLVDGLKFDLRVYAALISLDPVKVYVCKEGLARFCTEKYRPPDPKKGFGDERAHLTNYSLNKLSPKFIHAAGNAFAEDNNCSKRPLSVLLRQIRKKGITAPDGSQFDEEIFWDDVETCVSSTITAMLPVLRVSYARYFKTTPEEMRETPCRAFHLLGVDIMLRSDFSPVLIEVNNSPSLNLTQIIPINDGKLPPIKKQRHGNNGGRDDRIALSRGDPCHCNDFPTVHYHELSAVDEYVKVIAFGGTLDLLPKLTPAARAILKAEGGRNSQDIPGKGAGQCPKKYFFEAGSAGQDKVREVLRKIEIMFSRCGGAKKAFTAGALRQHFGRLPGLLRKGHFTKSNFDIIAAKYRGISLGAHDKGMDRTADEGMYEDMLVVDWGMMLESICKTRYSRSDHPVVYHMNRILDMMIDPTRVARERAEGKEAARVAAEEQVAMVVEDEKGAELCEAEGELLKGSTEREVESRGGPHDVHGAVAGVVAEESDSRTAVGAGRLRGTRRSVSDGNSGADIDGRDLVDASSGDVAGSDDGGDLSDP